LAGERPLVERAADAAHGGGMRRLQTVRQRVGRAGQAEQARAVDDVLARDERFAWV
jgi:hypothetical protein